MKKILRKAIPLWLAMVLVIDFSLLTGVSQYFFMKQQFNKAVAELKKTTKSPEEFVQILRQEVVPYKGYKTSIQWKDLGKQLVEAGAIDKQKFEEIFATEANFKDHMRYLDGSWNHNLIVNENNSRFILDTLWALGLVNKSLMLDEGPMKEGGDPGSFASTGGWTLGTKDAMQLYSSAEIIQLTPTQQELVKRIAENVYRPCCGNPTSFPDCNHGMAALGYIQLGVKEGLSEKQIYKDLLSLNSYWFPQTYVEMAAFFEKKGAKWNTVDAKLALSSQYSSAQATRQIQESIQDLPGFKSKQGGCTA